MIDDTQDLASLSLAQLKELQTKTDANRLEQLDRLDEICQFLDAIEYEITRRATHG